jgi:hypothetical protein
MTVGKGDEEGWAVGLGAEKASLAPHQSALFPRGEQSSTKARMNPIAYRNADFTGGPIVNSGLWNRRAMSRCFRMSLLDSSAEA